MLSHSVVSNSLPWTVTCQAPLSMGFSQFRGQTYVSCIGRQILYHCAIWEAHVFPRRNLENLPVQSSHCVDKVTYKYKAQIRRDSYDGLMVRPCQSQIRNGSLDLFSWCAVSMM